MKMFTRVLLAVVGLLVVVGALATIKGLQIGRMVAHSKSFVPPPQTVTTAQVGRMEWETALSAVGSTASVQGVMITAELTGKVTRIAFEAGAFVEAGQLLVQQDIAAEQAQLRAAESEAALTRKNLNRTQELHGEEVLPLATLDDSKARYEQAVAQVDAIRATIAKKTILAPFAGRLGLRQVNLGEFLDAGQAIVSLQTLNPIFVNFQLPQRELTRLKRGLDVRIQPDSPDSQPITGTITAMNPEVDPATRNILVQATVANPGETLHPGMFANVTVVLPAKREVLTIPATAVFHAPYSDSVFLVEKGDGQGLVLRQQFVQLGDKRGDFIAVRQGLEEGQTVVSTGVFKLRNGQAVVIDNTNTPAFELSPRPENT